MRNLTMMTDLYQLTMMYGYYKEGMKENEAVFDLFFRPKEAIEYAVMAGIESVIDYINQLHFDPEDLDYLRSLNLFDEDFISYLAGFSFTGDIYGMPEGTIVFPYEPLLRIKAPIMEAQLVETALLTLINHQTLIATKASRICYAAQGDTVLEFGLRLNIGVIVEAGHLERFGELFETGGGAGGAAYVQQQPGAYPPVSAAFDLLFHQPVITDFGHKASKYNENVKIAENIVK